MFDNVTCSGCYNARTRYHQHSLLKVAADEEMLESLTILPSIHHKTSYMEAWCSGEYSVLSAVRPGFDSLSLP